ncbi:hypothetical protein Tco_0760992 [Tanacetum coccineum]
MDKAHPLNSPMVGRSLDQKLDLFRPKEHDEDILGPEIPYLSTIGALMYLASNTRPYIAFSRSTKQSLTTTSSNHVKFIALYEFGQECFWLRSMIQYIQEECRLESIKGNPTILYEDSAACIAQIKESGQCELEVQKIIHLQRIANELSDAFIDTKRVPKSYNPASSRIDIPETLNESNIRRKRRRPMGSKDTNPRKRKEQNTTGKVTISDEEEENMVNERTLWEMATQNINQQPLCIQYPPLTILFELKSGLIHLLPTFRGLAGEDPHKHLKEFHVVCSTMKPQEVTEEQIKLRTFPFSLADKAKDWLYYSPSGLTCCKYQETHMSLDYGPKYDRWKNDWKRMSLKLVSGYSQNQFQAFWVRIAEARCLAWMSLLDLGGVYFAGDVILFGTIPTTIHDTTLFVTSPTTHIDTTPILTVSPTIPPSPTHGTPFTETTFFTQSSPVASGALRLHMMTMRKRVGPLPTHRLAVRHSVDYSSSDHFSSDDSSRDSSSSSSSETSSDSSASPSRKRSRSPAAFVPLSLPTLGALSYVRADLLPSPKRIRSPETATDLKGCSKDSFEPYVPREAGLGVDFEDESSEPSRSLEEDVEVLRSNGIDINPEIQAEIDEYTAYADALRDRGIDARVVVEAIDREEIETDVRGLVKVRFDRVTHPVVADDIPEPAQKGAVEDIESVQRDQGHRIVATGQQSVDMLERIRELERDNMRLRDMMDVAS